MEVRYRLDAIWMSDIGWMPYGSHIWIGCDMEVRYRLDAISKSDKGWMPYGSQISVGRLMLSGCQIVVRWATDVG